MSFEMAKPSDQKKYTGLSLEFAKNMTFVVIIQLSQ